MGMNVAIVGHGPSMLEAQHGPAINAHDKVVRLKRCSETLDAPLRFGSRTDFVCGSYTIAMQLCRDMPGYLYWVFLDSRHGNATAAEVLNTSEYVPAMILPVLCAIWNRRYREMREPYPCPEGVKSFGDPLGHPHMSAGLHAILYAGWILRPEKITLYGFDNVREGRFTWSVTRGREWDRYPDHNWPTEHRMVPMIAEKFGVEIAHV